ncbi:MAG TPA: sulfide/dihydroorotate dehydrogenase-like FAD/NAD-binding protein [Candidatus Brocadiia bacterium]|nr:sulfide/dihydroorotate dehydrogenase-like FAD/NAD-binding protein [Candidatus Brocadiia bacterium]
MIDFPIVEKNLLAPQLYEMKIAAPEIARKRKAGQFLILRIDEKGERFPLTIADADPAAGTVTIVFQAVGKSTLQLAAMNAGQTIRDVVGPLGKPTHIENFGRVVCVGGGVGIAPVHPIVCAMRQAGNHVTTILAARTRELIIMEPQMRAQSHVLKICTDDGSYGVKGFPTQIVQQMIDAGEKIDLLVVIGPVPLMRFMCDVTRKAGVPTVVSLNPIMVDGTGMCGGCRVLVGGVAKFACVDGPEFDGHQVDFDLLSKRQKTYLAEEKTSTERHKCRAIPNA